MHDEIIRYHINGEVSSQDRLKTKERMIDFLGQQMNMEGVVPVIELPPQFTVDYRPNTETFYFTLSMYGIFVGKEEECLTDAVTNGRTVPKHTPRARSPQS